MLKWKKKVSKITYAGAGSLFDYYVMVSFTGSYDCHYIFEDKKYKLAVDRFEEGKQPIRIAEFEADSKNMKKAKAIVNEILGL